MRRPRHRVKSNLLPKMLVVATLAGLSLAPILIGMGALQHVRTLVPVQLVTIPPSPPPTPKPPSPPPAPVAPAPPPRPRRVALLPPDKKKPSIPAPHPAPAAVKPPVVKKPTPAPKPAAALEARKARAEKLEKVAHALAVALAVRRAKEARVVPSRPTPASPPLTAAKPPAKPARVAVRPPAPPKRPAPPVRVATQPGGDPEGPQTPTPPETAPPPATPTPPEGAPPPPPVAPPKATPDYVPPEAVFRAKPTVPDRMLRGPLHAVFRCRFLIHPDGSAAVQPLVSTGRPDLDRRALTAARRWRFRPARRGGTPVESTMIIQMTFNVRLAA